MKKTFSFLLNINKKSILILHIFTEGSLRFHHKMPFYIIVCVQHLVGRNQHMWKYVCITIQPRSNCKRESISNSHIKKLLQWLLFRASLIFYENLNSFGPFCKTKKKWFSVNVLLLNSILPFLENVKVILKQCLVEK